MRNGFSCTGRKVLFRKVSNRSPKTAASFAILGSLAGLALVRGLSLLLGGATQRKTPSVAEALAPVPEESNEGLGEDPLLGEYAGMSFTAVDYEDQVAEQEEREQRQEAPGPTEKAMPVVAPALAEPERPSVLAVILVPGNKALSADQTLAVRRQVSEAQRVPGVGGAVVLAEAGEVAMALQDLVAPARVLMAGTGDLFLRAAAVLAAQQRLACGRVLLITSARLLDQGALERLVAAASRRAGSPARQVAGSVLAVVASPAELAGNAASLKLVVSPSPDSRVVLVTQQAVPGALLPGGACCLSADFLDRYRQLPAPTAAPGSELQRAMALQGSILAAVVAAFAK